MRKITFLMFFLLAFSIGTAMAADAVKPSVVVLFSDTLTGSSEERQEAKQAFLDKLVHKLAVNYHVTVDGGFSARLAVSGFNEPILAERSDLVSIFQNHQVNYVIIAYANDYVYNTLGGYNMPEYVFTLRFKVIDINKNRYLFDGQFYLPQKKSTLTKEYLGELYLQAERALDKLMP